MKKLSLLIALCMLISIGGVYAAWNYAGVPMSEAHEHMGIYLAAAESELVAEGTIVPVLKIMSATLDDLDNNHRAEVSITGRMAFVFKPGHGASDSVKENAVPLQFKVENRNPLVYEDMKVFTVNNASATDIDPAKVIKITAANIDTLEAQVGNGVQLDSYLNCFFFEITYDMVAGRFGSELELLTLEDYQTFSDWLTDPTRALDEILGITILKKPT